MDGVFVRTHLDSNGTDISIEHVQDVEPILRWNREARNEEQRSEWGRHVARIPNVIYVRWLDEEHARGNTALRMFTPEFDRIVQKKLEETAAAAVEVGNGTLHVSAVTNGSFTIAHSNSATAGRTFLYAILG